MLDYQWKLNKCKFFPTTSGLDPKIDYFEDSSIYNNQLTLISNVNWYSYYRKQLGCSSKN